jgi:hypothetical protein
MAFFGGTAFGGGGLSPEEKFYNLLQRQLGEGVFGKLDSDVRSRVLMSFARGMAAMDNEARRSNSNSVPCRSIEALGDWEEIFGVESAPVAFTTYLRRQNLMRALMESMLSTANPGRIEDWVALIIEDWAYCYENDQTTINSDDGDRYWSVIVPAWMAEDQYRTIYRLVYTYLTKIAPAHSVPCLCTSNDGGSPPEPMFYTDYYQSCACGKDAPGT